ncbi:hypothetical protein GCM10007908_33760 [Rhizobium albus]|nr:hypothetical protein GCM10007908_33760 [Rhizobium albus]
MHICESELLAVLSRFGYSSNDDYHDWTWQVENELATLLSAKIPDFLENQYPQHRPGSEHWIMFERIELNTIRYAMDQRISFTDVAWRDKTRLIADESGLLLHSYSRPAHRPSRRDADNPRFTSQNNLHRRDELRLLLDFKRFFEKSEGYALSDAAAIELMLTKLEESSKRRLHETDPYRFGNEVKKFRDKVSAQRTAAGIPATPPRKLVKSKIVRGDVR